MKFNLNSSNGFSRVLVGTAILASLGVLSSTQSAVGDVIWQHNNGQVHYWSMRNGQRTDRINIDEPVSQEWSLKGVGDVNGDRE